MLESLKINNFVLIPSLDLDLYDGMTVLTGETGSGKSIVLGALSLILGAKTDKEVIRSGAEKTEIEAVFKTRRKAVISLLDEKGIDTEDGIVLIRRIIKSNGRSHYSINGVSITSAEGLEIGRLLVDVTGQSSSLSLLKKENQRALLDSSKEIKDALSSFSSLYHELLSLEREKKETEEKIKRIENDRAFIEYSLNELESADLKAGEDDEIKEKLKIASNSEFLVENLTSVRESLDSASRSISAALTSLGKAKAKDESLDEYYTRLESISIETDDILQSISERIRLYSFDPYEMESLNSRLALLQRIRKKYGGSIESAIARRDEMRNEMESTDEDIMRLSRLEKIISEKKRECYEKAEILHSLRIKRASSLSKDITATLRSLSMESAEFVLDVQKTEEMGEYGFDRIAFLIAPNKGEKMSAVESTASGGELSRIMLAIKSNFLNTDDVETLFFDEIDSGISGHAASNVASVMKKISTSHQIIAITHLAQIARCADYHILVDKSEKEGRTVSHLRYIEADARVKEIARLLSGDETEISIRHAESLVGECRN